MANCFQEAIYLKKRFSITEVKTWTALNVMNELSVQLGHYACILSGNNYVKEIGRNIYDKEDEISDILLQLCAICEKLDIDNYLIELDKYSFISEEKAIIDMIALIGQLEEAIMELEGYRHEKNRQGYTKKEEFILDRISKIFTIIFSIVEVNNYDIIKCFKKMCDNAHAFLDKWGEQNV